MKEYKVFGVRLPFDASARIEDASERTGIQKAVLLRSIILNWIEKEQSKPVVGAELGGTTPIAGGHQTPVGADADV